MELSKEDFEALVPATNMVLIKPDIDATKFITLENGFNLQLYTDFERERFAATTGECIKVCKKTFFHKTGGIDISLLYDSEIEMEPGDKVYYHYSTMEKATKDGQTFMYNGELYAWVTYDRFYCGKRNDEVVMYNGFVLLEPVEDNSINSSILQIPTELKNRSSKRYGRVAYVGKPCKGYYEDKPADDRHIEVKKGDVVLFENYSDIPLQYSFLADLEGKQRFFRTQRLDFVAIAKSHIFESESILES